MKNENGREVKAYFYILIFIDKIWRLVENVPGVRTSRWIVSCSHEEEEAEEEEDYQDDEEDQAEVEFTARRM